MKILAYNIGDGTLYFAEKENKGFAWFYGTPEDLERIRNDIRKLGFTPSKIYKRRRVHRIRTKYGVVKFESTEYSFNVSSRSFVALLHALGAPLGDKTYQRYEVPAWLLKCPKWIKRLFLASLFGAEMSSPFAIREHGYNFYMPYLSLNKVFWLVEDGKKFLNQIASLLEEFGVEVAKIVEGEEYLNQYMDITKRIKLLIKATPQNLIKLYENINFEYNSHRKWLANVAIQYLKLKLKVIAKRKEVQKVAIAMATQGKNLSEICNSLCSEFINRRFIERSVYEGRKTDPRIPFNFPKFLEFLEAVTRGLGKSGAVWDEIEEIKEVEFNDFVYDFTVKHKDHNFIANNFVVSNCGVRLLRTSLTLEQIRPKLKQLLEEIFKNVPSGVGRGGKIKLSPSQLQNEVLEA